jgi:hypothetical protein
VCARENRRRPDQVQRQREWRRKNPEKCREYVKRYYYEGGGKEKAAELRKESPERHRGYVKKARAKMLAKDPDYHKRKIKEWMAAHPEYHKKRYKANREKLLANKRDWDIGKALKQVPEHLQEWRLLMYEAQSIRKKGYKK